MLSATDFQSGWHGLNRAGPDPSGFNTRHPSQYLTDLHHSPDIAPDRIEVHLKSRSGVDNTHEKNRKGRKNKREIVRISAPYPLSLFALSSLHVSLPTLCFTVFLFQIMESKVCCLEDLKDLGFFFFKSSWFCDPWEIPSNAISTCTDFAFTILLPKDRICLLCK